MAESQHSWETHDHDAAEHWLRNYRRLVDNPDATPRPVSFDALGLHIMEVQLKPCITDVRRPDVFVSQANDELS